MMVGFAKPEPVKVSGSSGKSSVSIYLSPVSRMDEIVVDAQRNPNRAGKTVISGKELYDMPGASGDPVKAIMALPGITVGQNPSGGGSPAIRGSSSEDNIFYIDFMPAGYIFHFGGIYSVIHHDLVDDFNLYLSSPPAEFDSRIGGVIDVNLRDPREDRWGVKASVSMFESDILVEGPVAEDQSILFTARRSYIDFFIDALDEETKDKLFEDVSFAQFPKFSDYTGKYVWKIDTLHTLSVTALGAEDEMSMTLDEDSDAIAQEPLFAGDFNFSASFHTQGITLNSVIGESMQNRLGVNHRTFMNDIRPGGVGHVAVDVELLQLRERLAIDRGDHNFLFGFNYEKSNVDIVWSGQFDMPSEFDPDVDFSGAEHRELEESYDGQSATFYTQDRWRITDKITLVPGVQYFSLIDEDISALMPRAAIELDADKTLLFTLAWGQYIQYPQGPEIVDVWGNPDLDLLRSEHYTVGVDKKLNDGWQVKTEVYYKTFDDLPVPHDTLNYVNDGSGEAWGAELLLKKKANSSPFSGWASVAYAKTERTNDLTGESFNTSFDQPWIANLVARYETDFKWIFSGRWRYQTGSPYTPVTGAYVTEDGRTRPVYGEINSVRLPDYHQLDLRAAREYRHNTWKMELFFEIINAYNRANVGGYQYNADYTEKEEIAGLPILPSVGIKAEF